MYNVLLGHLTKKNDTFLLKSATANFHLYFRRLQLAYHNVKVSFHAKMSDNFEYAPTRFNKHTSKLWAWANEYQVFSYC